MIGVKFRMDKNEIGIRLNGIRSQVAKFPEEATQEFKKLTPIDTGNARRKTTLQNKRTIVADYPYAVPLDKGHSKQAPQGMTKPFEKWVAAKIKQIFGR